MHILEWYKITQVQFGVEYSHYSARC